MGKDKRAFSKGRARLSHCLMVSFFCLKKKNQSVFGVGGRIEGGRGGVKIPCFELPV